MLLWFVLALTLLALAEGDQVRVTLVVDDRDAKRLSAAQVVVEQNPPVVAPLTDDGTCPGDMPGDRILTACMDIQKRESLSFGVLEGSQRMGAFNLFLPNADEATVSLRTKEGAPALLLDMAAETPMYAPSDQQEAETPRDRILVMVSIDDRTGALLRDPELRAMDRDDVDPVRPSDAGLLLGDAPGDGIWRADLAVLRTASLSLGLFDGGRSLGQVEFTLPAKQRAYVVLTPSDDPAGLEARLEEEPPDADRERDTILVMFSIDDQVERALVEPEIRVTDREGVEPVVAGDSGLLLGDRAADGVWRADLLVERTATLGVALYDQGQELGTTVIDLPAKQRAYVDLLRVDEEPGLLSRLNQESPDADRDRDTILLMLAIDDQDARAFEGPEVRVTDRDGVEPVSASDAGLMLGDEADDGLWRADLTVERTDTLALAVYDGGELLGTLDLDLPTKRRAAVIISVDEDGGGLSARIDQELPSELRLESCSLRVSVEDTTERALGAPEIRVEGQQDVDPVLASDEGLLSSDVAGDGTWRADITVMRTPTLTLALRDGETALGSTTFPLPSSSEVAISLVRRGDPAQLTATTEAIGSTSATETISLVISLDDRVAKLLEQPAISSGTETASASDDGSTPGDKADDGIYVTEMEATRVPVITLEVLDDGVSEGTVDVPLPASGSAEIYLRTRRGSPAIMLVEMLEKGGARGGGGTGGGSIWIVVWLNVALFLVLFVWVRRTIKRAIDRELQARSGGTPPPDVPPPDQG